MPLALKRYLICLSLVGVVMALYSWLVDPWLQSPKRDTALVAVAVSDNQVEGWWSELFAPDDWQNQRPMVIQTEQGTLLFKSLKQLDSGERVNLSPLTLIVPLSQAARSVQVGDLNASLNVYRNSELAVIVAPEGAEIEFEKVPDWTKGPKPPVVRGQLLGQIQITGIKPQSEVPATDSRVAWSIRTAHVRIEGRRVWTNHEVEFIAGNSQATGKDLAIGLKRDLMGSGPRTEGQFGLLDYLELRTIKEVNVNLPPGGLWKDFELGRPEVAQAHANVPARVTLRCKGSLVFDFDESRASLSDHVDVEHRFENDAHADQFMCHELIAHFAATDTNAAPDEGAVMVGPLRLEGVDALGIDSVGPRPAQSTVQILAPNISTELVAKWLRVKLKAKQTEFFLDSRNGRSSEGARSGMTQIMLSYLGNVFRAPDLYYSKLPGDQQISLLKSNGPGEVQTAADSPVGQATARWKTSLTMRPGELNSQPSAVAAVPNAQLILLDGMAELQAHDRGHLRSDQIVVSLRSSPSTGANSLQSNQTGMRVERLDAFSLDRTADPTKEVVGDVILGNPTQNSQVKKLHFEFLYPQASSDTAAKNNLELSDAAGRPMRQWVGPPPGTSAVGQLRSNSSRAGQTAVGDNTPLAPSEQTSSAQSMSLSAPPIGLPLPLGPATNQPATNQPATNQPSTLGNLASTPTTAPAGARVLILGKELHSKIIMAAPKPWIDQLIITGPVVVSPDGEVEPGAPVWRVAGNEVTLNGGTDEHYELQIVGKSDAPARITFGDGWIEGPVVRLSQRTGHLWIDQPGTLCVPVGLMSKPNATGNNPPLAGGPLGSQPGIEWIEPIKVHWDGGMLFNGLTANIRGHITFDGYARTGPDRLLFLKGSCESVEVRLTENINLGNPGKTSSTIHSVTLRDNVDIRSAQTDLQRNRISLEEILLPEMTFEVATNILRGRGPGEIHSQHQSTGGPIGTLAGSSQANTAKLQGLHLTFRDYMELKLVDKMLDFRGRVEVGIGPVQSLDQFIDIATMRTLQPEQSLLRGDHLRIYDTSDLVRGPTASLAEGAWEMEANGNVNFETRTESGEMVGRASRITYIQSKELVVINGDPQIPAEIRFRPDDASRYALAVLSLWQGSINTRSLQPSGDLKIAGNSQFVPRGGNVPDNWKTGNINAASAAQASPNSPPVNTPARPRDAINEWFKQ